MNEMRKVLALQDQVIKNNDKYAASYNTYLEKQTEIARKEFEREYSKAYMKLLSEYRG